MALKNSGIPSYTWATKPAVANWPTYRPIILTDIGVGGSMWHHNGVNWYPTAGTVKLYSLHGSLATPITTLTGTAGALFTLPGGNPQIPAGLLVSGKAKLHYEGRLRKTTATAAASIIATLGVNNSASDDQIMNKSTGAAANSDVRGDANVWIVSATVATVDSNAAPHAAGGATQFADRTAAINTAAAMYAGIGISGANVEDSFSLLSFSVILEM